VTIPAVILESIDKLLIEATCARVEQRFGVLSIKEAILLTTIEGKYNTNACGVLLYSPSWLA
jgi:hypothetical protein